MLLRKKRNTGEIPTASMADIAFLLIIFFMVTTVFSATKGLDFKLPKDDESQEAETEAAVFIKVYENGALTIDKNPANLDEILPYLQPKLERWPDKPVILYTTPEADYEDMIAVYDLLQQGENTIGTKVNVTIPTQKEVLEYAQVFGYNPFED